MLSVTGLLIVWEITDVWCNVRQFGGLIRPTTYDRFTTLRPASVLFVVAQDYFKMAAGTATIMAHELGHSFGFLHDGIIDGPCACSDPGGRCIMVSHF